MHTPRALIVAVLLFAAAAFQSAALAYGERDITGELVVIKGTTSQFRIVQHPGTFTAPSGVPLTSLDGHNVRVSIGPNGKVESITEVPVPIAPVAHGFSTVRGELVVTDQLNRRFTVAGDNQVYTAPPSADITVYKGQVVEFKVDESGNVTELRAVGPASAYPTGEPPYAVRGAPPYPATGSSYSAPAVPPPPAATACTYGGEAYSAGAAICQAGMLYRCDGSQWHSLGTTCGSDTNTAGVPPAPPRSCLVGGATVASGSGICRDGTTYRCDDGTWVNIQTACR